MSTPQEMRDRIMEFLEEEGLEATIFKEVEIFLELQPDPHEAIRRTLASGSFEEILELLPKLPSRTGDFVHLAIVRLVELVSTIEQGWELFDKAKYPLDHEIEFDRLFLAKIFTLARTKEDYRDIYLVCPVGSSLGHNCLAKIKELMEQEGQPA